MTVLVAPPDADSECIQAREIRRLAMARWGDRFPTVVVGRHPALVAALERLGRLADSDNPVLVTGETGTGKELFARALYLLSGRASRPFLSINCAQYHDGSLLASELFGHKRGSFTGAIADHLGVFEDADGGVVFLDEIGELSMPAQAMLLRALGEGEIIAVGRTRATRVDVRVIAATSRDLRAMVTAGTFRLDLYYRLRHFHIHVPALRERGEDWRLIVDYLLSRANTQCKQRKYFSTDAVARLGAYHWPGNVREVGSIVETAFHVSAGDCIESAQFAEELEAVSRAEQMMRIPVFPECQTVVDTMIGGGQTFWEAVHEPYMRREMRRTDVRAVIAHGLQRTQGSYKKLLKLFGVAECDYLRFMDFLRHQQLKPED